MYAVFALAASARAGVQLATKYADAPLAYLLSALAAVVYVVATVTLARASTTSRRIATAAIVLELVGVRQPGHRLVETHQLGGLADRCQLRGRVVRTFSLRTSSLGNAGRRRADGRRFDVHARAVVNATGVWSDDVRALDEGHDPDSIRPAKGIHITVPWDKVRNDIAVVVPVPKDKRSVFVVPWLPLDGTDFQLTYIGTTDTDYDGPLDDPQCTPDDVSYLL